MSHFYAYLAKMKYISRWGLMRNTWSESLQDHSFQVAMITHGLAVIRNQLFSGSINPERAALLALFHDAGEVIVGDLPSPIKHSNENLRAAFEALEETARQRLVSMLPEELQAQFEPLFQAEAADCEHLALVAAADKICAYLKCLEERRAGNLEFTEAEKTIRRTLQASELPEVAYFIRQFTGSFTLTLDELN